MDGRKNKVTLMAKSRARKIKIERVYQVGQEISGVKVLEVFPEEPERFSEYRIKNLCCGSEGTVQHKTLYYRSMKGVTLCRSCSHKLTLHNRWGSPMPKPKRKAFDKAPVWGLPSNNIHPSECQDATPADFMIDVATEQLRLLTIGAIE